MTERYESVVLLEACGCRATGGGGGGAKGAEEADAQAGPEWASAQRGATLWAAAPAARCRGRIARIAACGVTCAAAAAVFLAAVSSQPGRQREAIRDEVGLVEWDCQDTPAWHNGWSGCAYSKEGKDPSLCALSEGGQWPSTVGYTCLYYQKKGLCQDGHYKDFAMGAGLNSPEENCCACKGYKPEAQCNRDTYGSCRFTRFCNGWRGPTNCENGKCICKPGYCADSAGTCQRNSRADAFETKINRQKGVVTEAHECSGETSGTCFLSGCEFWRGATECKAFQCHCKPGYCVDQFGGCFKDMGVVKAAVVPVNQVSAGFPGAQVTTALCLSGGGSRALSASLGMFRALRDLGLVGRIDAISSVSGGSWAAAIFMFADMDLNTLLGPATEPGRLTLPALDAKPAPLGAVALSKANDIAIRLKMAGVPFGMLWVATVAEAFLQPFGLNRLDAFMAPSAEAVEQIQATNPQYKDVLFQVPQPGRAGTVVLNSAVEAPVEYNAAFSNVVSLQVAPDFTGSPFYPNDAPVDYISATLGSDPLDKVLLGGGLVSTFAFGSAAPTKRKDQLGGTDVEMQAPTRPFSLARSVGMSSAAFGAVMTHLPGMGSNLNPQVPMWPVASNEHPKPQPAMNYMIGDGGNLENTGILPMLQRGASKIVAMINGAEELTDVIDFCSTPASAVMATGAEITGQFANLFGYGKTADNVREEFHVYNQVFAADEYLPIICELQQLRGAGKPLALRKSLTVQANSWWGIAGGRVVDIVFCILGKAVEFERQLPADTQQALAASLAGGLYGFPGLKTTFQNPPDLTQYTERQINLLAAQTEWAAKQNAALLREMFG